MSDAQEASQRGWLCCYRAEERKQVGGDVSMCDLLAPSKIILRPFFMVAAVEEAKVVALDAQTSDNKKSKSSARQQELSLMI